MGLTSAPAAGGSDGPGEAADGHAEAAAEDALQARVGGVAHWGLFTHHLLGPHFAGHEQHVVHAYRFESAQFGQQADGGFHGDPIQLQAHRALGILDHARIEDEVHRRPSQHVLEGLLQRHLLDAHVDALRQLARGSNFIAGDQHGIFENDVGQVMRVQQVLQGGLQPGILGLDLDGCCLGSRVAQAAEGKLVDAGLGMFVDDEVDAGLFTQMIDDLLQVLAREVEGDLRIEDLASLLGRRFLGGGQGAGQQQHGQAEQAAFVNLAAHMRHSFLVISSPKWLVGAPLPSRLSQRSEGRFAEVSPKQHH